MKKNIGKDFIELVNDSYLSDMAISHLECWEDRYRNYKNQKQMMFDLTVNHDDSLEIERTEEDLKRELSNDEYDFLINKFHKAVGKHWRTGQIVY